MKKILLSLVLVSFLSACGLVSHQIGISLVSTVQETPANVEFTNLEMKGTKTGKACGKNILGIIAEGDITVDAAKKNGGISTITSVSKEVKNMFIFSEVCTVVKGF